MDDLLDETKRKIWQSYWQNNNMGRFDLSSFIDSAHSVVPELSYDECCRMALEKTGKEGINIPFSPDAFIAFCRRVVQEIKPQNVLIPLADGSETTIFVEDTQTDYIFQDITLEELARKHLSINIIEKIEAEKTYDLILSDLPLGPVYGKDTGAGKLVEESMHHLSTDGYALFTFFKGITFGKGRKWIDDLKDKGLYCNAILDMPIKSYGHIIPIDSVIAVFSKKEGDKLFVASLSEESVIEKIVKNFLSGNITTTNPKMGIYVEGDVFSYSEYNDLCRLLNKRKSLSKAYNGPLVKLCELGVIQAPRKDNKFEEGVTSVFLPKVGNSPAVASVEEFKIKPQNYFQIVIDEVKVLQRFLIYFLNSEEGQNLRQLSSSGSVIPSLNTTILKEFEIPCPSIEIQAEYLETYEQLERLRAEVIALETKFHKTPASYKNIRREMKDINNHADKFDQWVESLPYPLATILKQYSVSDNNTKRQEILFYFFEAYSIFESTILSAALDKTIMDCSSLKNVDPKYFEKASFGNWVRMDRMLSNIYLSMLNSNNEEQKKLILSSFQTKDDSVIKYFCSKNICNILEQASERRNLWKAHSGITSEAIYKDHVAELDSLLRKVQECIKDLYERVRLIRPLSIAFVNGEFDNKIEILTGSNSIFVKDNIKSLTALDSAKLYLQILDTGEMLELPPYFILKNSPSDVKNACYFYSRVEGGNTRYVSYHFDGRPEDLENGETAFDMIKNILTN